MRPKEFTSSLQTGGVDDFDCYDRDDLLRLRARLFSLARVKPFAVDVHGVDAPYIRSGETKWPRIDGWFCGCGPNYKEGLPHEGAWKTCRGLGTIRCELISPDSFYCFFCEGPRSSSHSAAPTGRAFRDV